MVPRKAPARSYHAATNSQFIESWFVGNTSADSEIRPSLSRLRNLCRSLERDNPYFRRFLAEWVSNVIGPHGFTFRSLASDGDTPDDNARKVIEQAFKEWKRAKNCTVTGDMCYSEVKALSERGTVRDGNIIIRILRGFPDSDFKFALQIIEGDHVDCDYNRTFPDGSRIVMGKEMNAYGRPVAYHITGDHPGDTYSYNGRQRTRIPARDIIHRYYRERPGQAMGTPLVTASITGLRHIERYEEAEQVAAQISARSTVSIEKEFQPGYDGGEDSQSDFAMDLELGGVWDLPYGTKASLINPTHPNANYEQFRKGVLRGVASGMLSNYNIIGSDLEGVNYSSLREGKINMNALVRGFRAINIEAEEIPIFEAWLEWSLAMDYLYLPLAKIDKFRAAEWQGRGFDWVDPLKDAKGIQTDLENGITSLSRVLSERGTNIETILSERARDLSMFEKYGLTPPAWFTSGAQDMIPDKMDDE